MELNGDFASVMTPIADKPLHFIANGLTWAPMFAADPQAGATQPYHMYFRRHEPTIVFGDGDSGVLNAKRVDGLTFLDVAWASAPFVITVGSSRRLSALLRSGARPDQ